MQELSRRYSFAEGDSLSVNVLDNQMLMVFDTSGADFNGIGQIGNPCYLVITLGSYKADLHLNKGVLEIFSVSREVNTYQWASNKVQQMMNDNKCGNVDVWLGK